MGEERSKAKEKYQLVFAINGVRFELSSVHPSTTLLHFLRTDTAFKSVKLSCGEDFC
ncbi:aldehyde oxidase, putative [Ricinus communis]|uniref:Aldehyde oxidase, putative n=1 Tax=Ricinus communis TaxID=3988 RepID=B9RQ15_RICCO|nr:aldehyde oxidase, putative [Ricinus communis]